MGEIGLTTECNMGKKPRSPMIKEAQGISAQERSAGQANINTGVGDIQTATSNPTASPLYKALYSTEAGSMSKAYDAAAGNTAARARQSGFGYQQPAAQGAQDELRGREASQIGQLPGQVMSETVPMEMQAGKDIAGVGAQELGEGNQMYTQGAMPLEKQYQDYSLNYKPLWQRMLQGAIPNPAEGKSGGLVGALGSA
jgi:hypothetical protein